jgi:chromosome segregation ATPase
MTEAGPEQVAMEDLQAELLAEIEHSAAMRAQATNLRADLEVERGRSAGLQVHMNALRAQMEEERGRSAALQARLSDAEKENIRLQHRNGQLRYLLTRVYRPRAG